MNNAIAFVPERGKVELVAAPEAGEPGKGEVLVQTELVGFCGTDREIVQGGIAVHPGDGHLILGHEMMGVVLSAGESVEGLEPGNRVVPMVRLPCGKCAPCLADRSDFCLTGQYLEYGITRLHGFARPSLVIPATMLLEVPAGLGDLAVLAEPVSIAEKTLDQARYLLSRIPGHVLNEADWGAGLRALVTGAGSIGLLTIYLLTEVGFEVQVADIRSSEGLSAQLAEAAGASYVQLDRDEPFETIADRLDRADLAIEATGNPNLAFALLDVLAPGGVLMWVGVASEEHVVKMEASRAVLKAVLGHNAIVGTVNSGRLYMQKALADLVHLSRRPRFEEVLTGVVAVEEFVEAIWPSKEAVKQAVSYRDMEWRS